MTFPHRFTRPLLQLTAAVVAVVLLCMVLSQSVYAQGGTATDTAAGADVATGASTDGFTWYSLDENGVANVDLYFFWSETCPHCQHAHPYIMSLPDELPWLRLHALELNAMPENAELYMKMAAALGQQAQYVPAFIYCGTMQAGYDENETTGAALRQSLIDCQARAQAELAPLSVAAGTEGGEGAAAAGSVAAGAAVAGSAGQGTATTIPVPFVGEVSVASLSLPVLTLLIAGVDSINPCAIFVLMFLLSLMVHAQSRSRMLMIGVVFVLFSGLIYFIFMAAWLNVFLWVGELRVITLIAGLVALVIGMINVKDFFWYKQGVSLSIPESAKPGLYARTRTLVQAGSLGAMLVSTALLAVAANSYELLCTAGFPMVYTRILTMAELPTSVYYAYLAAYNVIYVIPLLVIVVVFTAFLGSRKLGEEEGRALKLVSGLMMVMLGFVLVFQPEQLTNMAVSVGLVLGALVLAIVIIVIDRKRRPPAPKRQVRRARAH